MESIIEVKELGVGLRLKAKRRPSFGECPKYSERAYRRWGCTTEQADKLIGGLTATLGINTVAEFFRYFSHWDTKKVVRGNG